MRTSCSICRDHVEHGHILNVKLMVFDVVVFKLLVVSEVLRTEAAFEELDARVPRHVSSKHGLGHEAFAAKWTVVPVDALMQLYVVLQRRLGGESPRAIRTDQQRRMVPWHAATAAVALKRSTQSTNETGRAERRNINNDYCLIKWKGTSNDSTVTFC